MGEFERLRIESVCIAVLIIQKKLPPQRIPPLPVTAFFHLFIFIRMNNHLPPYSRQESTSQQEKRLVSSQPHTFTGRQGVQQPIVPPHAPELFPQPGRITHPGRQLQLQSHPGRVLQLQSQSHPGRVLQSQSQP